MLWLATASINVMQSADILPLDQMHENGSAMHVPGVVTKCHSDLTCPRSRHKCHSDLTCPRSRHKMSLWPDMSQESSQNVNVTWHVPRVITKCHCDLTCPRSRHKMSLWSDMSQESSQNVNVTWHVFSYDLFFLSTNHYFWSADERRVTKKVFLKKTDVKFVIHVCSQHSRHAHIQLPHHYSSKFTSSKYLLNICMNL